MLSSKCSQCRQVWTLSHYNTHVNRAIVVAIVRSRRICLTALIQGPVLDNIHILAAVEVWSCKSPAVMAVISNVNLTICQSLDVMQHYK